MYFTSIWPLQDSFLPVCRLTTRPSRKLNDISMIYPSFLVQVGSLSPPEHDRPPHLGVNLQALPLPSRGHPLAAPHKTLRGGTIQIIGQAGEWVMADVIALSYKQGETLLGNNVCECRRRGEERVQSWWSSHFSCRVTIYWQRIVHNFEQTKKKLTLPTLCSRLSLLFPRPGFLEHDGG